MLRRDFLVGSAAGVAALAVSPSALVIEPPLSDLGLYPRQEMMRQQARLANEVHLLWGQRSGKGRTTGAMVADRIRTRGVATVLLVGHRDMLDSTISAVHSDLHELGVSPQGIFSVVSAEAFRRQTSAVDIVILDEVDWQTVPAHSLINHAREISSFFVSVSSPRHRNSDYMNYVLFNGSMGFLGNAWDWASTWEVNPLVSRASLKSIAVDSPEGWERDFKVYKDHSGLIG